MRAALEADGSLDSFVIDVTAQGGEVRLSGLVNNVDASKNAEAKARAVVGSRVVNTLQVKDFYGGLMEAGKRSITIVKVKAGEVLFAATVDVPPDFLEKPWKVSKEILQKAPHTLVANAQRFTAGKDKQHDRNAGLLQKTLGDLGDLTLITIRRDEW